MSSVRAGVVAQAVKLLPSVLSAHGCWFDFWLFHIRSGLLQVRLEKQQDISSLLGPLVIDLDEVPVSWL